MLTTNKTPTRRKERQRTPDWGKESTSRRWGVHSQGRPAAALAARRASRATPISPAADEMPGRPASLEVTSGEAPATGLQTRLLSPVRQRQSGFWSEFSAAQPLLVFSFLLGVMFTVLFGLDLCTGWLFWRASVLMDVSFTLCGLGLILLCWNVYRDFR
ncbi:MAG TPA: hypothetical protein PLF81_29470 [Candidatus Anammoximicrobium sp.]|nr:hypothetical protein [Candidatus Anammoximicrobium sp.]